MLGLKYENIKNINDTSTSYTYTYEYTNEYTHPHHPKFTHGSSNDEIINFITLFYTHLAQFERGL